MVTRIVPVPVKFPVAVSVGSRFCAVFPSRRLLDSPMSPSPRDPPPPVGPPVPSPSPPSLMCPPLSVLCDALPCFGFVQVLRVAVGNRFTIAADASGRLWSWGRGVDGQLGTGPASKASNSPVAVDMPNRCEATCCCRCCGVPVIIITNLPPAVAHCPPPPMCVFCCCLFGSFPTPSPPPAMPSRLRFVEVAASDSHCAACTDNGHVYTWGR